MMEVIAKEQIYFGDMLTIEVAADGKRFASRWRGDSFDGVSPNNIAKGELLIPFDPQNPPTFQVQL